MCVCPVYRLLNVDSSSCATGLGRPARCFLRTSMEVFVRFGYLYVRAFRDYESVFVFIISKLK